MRTNEKQLSRRSFLRNSALVAGGTILGASTLQTIKAHYVWANNQGNVANALGTGAIGYGPLAPVGNQNGDQILALPDGFHYVTFSKIGDVMSDGNLTPINHDGMAAFPGPDGTVRLIRNQEVRNAPDNNNGAVGGPNNTKYDPLGVGGTVTADYDPRQKKLVRDFISLNGTIVNCAGGFSYQDRGWITCEETIAGPSNGWGKKHGYDPEFTRRCQVLTCELSSLTNFDSFLSFLISLSTLADTLLTAL